MSESQPARRQREEGFMTWPDGCGVKKVKPIAIARRIIVSCPRKYKWRFLQPFQLSLRDDLFKWSKLRRLWLRPETSWLCLRRIRIFLLRIAAPRGEVFEMADIRMEDMRMTDIRMTDIRGSVIQKTRTSESPASFDKAF